MQSSLKSFHTFVARAFSERHAQNKPPGQGSPRCTGVLVPPPQELHEGRVTLMEGSAVSGQDLVGARAEKAAACLLLADRFTTDPEQEDLSILFQVGGS